MSVWETSSSDRTMKPEQMVIGEAVAVEVAPATVGLRLLSGFIDYALYGGGLWLSLMTLAILGARIDASPAQFITWLSILLVLWWLMIPLTVETLSRGRSAGKLITGTRIVRDDGGSIRFRHAFVRTLVASVEVWITAGVVAMIACAASKRGKRLGDMLAGTYAVCERSGHMKAAPLLMPPELALWASHADIRPLPGNLTLTARTFLQRASTMEAPSRRRLGRELAGEVERFVFPAPPAGTHPERFLAAVLCERRDRELAMARRDARTEQQLTAAAHALPYEM